MSTGRAGHGARKARLAILGSPVDERQRRDLAALRRSPALLVRPAAPHRQLTAHAAQRLGERGEQQRHKPQQRQLHHNLLHRIGCTTRGRARRDSPSSMGGQDTRSGVAWQPVPGSCCSTQRAPRLTHAMPAAPNEEGVGEVHHLRMAARFSVRRTLSNA